MNADEKKDINWINSLKEFCILLVVLYHVVSPGYAEMIKHLTAGFIPAKFWLVFNEKFSPLRMPAFFFVSGMLASNSIINRSWKQVLTSRVINLFYLYFLWGFIQWFMIRGLSSHIMGEQLSANTNAAWAKTPFEFIKLMLLAMSSSWYLYALGLFFVLSKVFRQQQMTILLMAVVLNYAAVTKVIPGWGPESLAQDLLFFLLGGFWSSTLIRWSEWHRSNLPVWLALAVLPMANMMLGVSLSLFVCVLSVLSVLLSIAVCRQLNQRCSLWGLNWLGRNTLQIYVLHRIFIEFFGMSMILFAGQHNLFASHTFSLLWAVGFPPVMVLLCSGCSVGVWALLNRGMGKGLFLYPRLLRMKCDP